MKTNTLGFGFLRRSTTSLPGRRLNIAFSSIKGLTWLNVTLVHPYTTLMQQQKTTYFNLGLIILAVSLLNACSTLPIENASKSQQWLEHQVKVSEIKAWKINARIAVQNGEESGTATLHWNQYNSDYEIRFIASWGQGSYLLKGTSKGVVMLGPKKKALMAETADKLILEGLGWDIHLDGLKYWIRGLPEPDIHYSQLVLDEQGRLLDMKQSGFTVSISRYADQNGISLPEKIRIKNDNIQIKLVINNWNI